MATMSALPLPASAVHELIAMAQIVRGIPSDNYPMPYPSLCAMLLQYPGHRNEETLTYFDENNQRTAYTYHDLLAEIIAVAIYLSSLDVGKGSRVAIAAHNHSDTVIQYCAIWMCGACIVPLNMGEDDKRLHYILESSGASVLLCRQEYYDRIQAISAQNTARIIPVYDRLNPMPADSLHALIQHHALHTDTQHFQEPTVPHLDYEALLVYTSGTTGNPKGVILTQRTIMADCSAIAEWHHAHTSTRWMCVLPIHHVNGIIVTLCTPLLSGGKIILNKKFQSSLFFQRCIEERVDIVSVVPTLLAFLTETSISDELRTALQQSVLRIICGAGPLTCDTVHRFQSAFGMRIIHGYGLSETTCYSCYVPTDISDEEYAHWMYDHGFPSIGTEITTNEMAIHSPDGIAQPPSTRGEIVIRGCNVMQGYADNLSANAEAFKHGWFRSGDEGFYEFDHHGRKFFFITGRIKELIIRGGVNISPLEIDEILAQAPGVRSGLCVGFDHRFYGEEVGAVVIPTSSDVQTEDILLYCQERLPLHKAPKVIVFVDTLPITSTGKYQRNKVKHLFAQWHDVQFHATSLRHRP